MYNLNFDEEEASKLTARDYKGICTFIATYILLLLLKSSQNDLGDTKFIKMVKSFHNAWTLVKSFLTTYGKNSLINFSHTRLL